MSALDRRLVVYLSLFLMLLPGYTQESENKDTEEEARVLESVTVTARKREVDLQEAPVSISVMEGDDFEEAGIVRLDNANGYIPGLVVAKNDGAGRVVAIRGVGWETAQNLSTQPSVLVYLDGVYLANPLALGLDLGEIDHIEVLRGPQGTEFGQGTTGGAINIITKKPNMDEVSGTLSMDIGDYGQHREAAALNFSVSNQTAIRAYVQNHERDGYAEIAGGAFDGYQLDDAEAVTAHVSMTTVFNPNLSLRISGYYSDGDHGGAAQKHIDDPNPDPRRLTQDYPSTFGMENQSLSAEMTWLTGDVTVKWITGYQELKKNQTMDGDRLTEELTSVNLTGFGENNFDVLPFWFNNSRAFTQEINATWTKGQWDGIVGAYYLEHTNDNFFLEAVGPAPFSQFDDVLANPGPDTLPPFTPPLEFVEDRTLTREDTAVYGQMVYNLNDRTAITAGARFQNDDSVDDTTQFWFIESSLETKDDAFTWKAGIDWWANDNALVFALVSTGWKNGGNNPGALNGALDVPVSFEPEEVTSFEVGTKTTALLGAARLNATFFYYDYQNYQFIMEDPVPFSGGTGNIPDVTIYGVELETSVLLGQGWRVDAFLSSNDGEIDSDLFTLDTVDFLNSGFGRFTATGVQDRASLRVNLNGNTPPKLVDLMGRATLSHSGALYNGVLTSKFDVIYRGAFQYRVFNNPLVDDVPSYTTLGLHFNYDFNDTPVSLSLRASNLTDEAGVNARYSNPFGLHTTSEEYIPPREIAVGAKYRF